LIIPLKKNAIKYEIKASAVICRSNRPKNAPKEVPFKNDKEAVEVATKWLTLHFGKLGTGVELSVIGIQHSSSGHEKPVYDWDFGHTISFTANYRGIRTDHGAVVYITGKTDISATVELFKYTTLGKRRSLVSAADSKKALLTRLSKQKNTVDLQKWIKSKKPELRFVWSPAANAKVDYEYDVLAPSWMFGDRYAVDGFTGAPWVND
jgi:hypothetical protein